MPHLRYMVRWGDAPESFAKRRRVRYCGSALSAMLGILAVLELRLYHCD